MKKADKVFWYFTAVSIILLGGGFFAMIKKKQWGIWVIVASVIIFLIGTLQAALITAEENR